jgi:hypothetical protein
LAQPTYVLVAKPILNLELKGNERRKKREKIGNDEKGKEMIRKLL